ncbi:hypothetical protein O6H91_11G107800 [Diphasiastrum complanatum]|uniref:Uncharacterized protein n=1 Tax=Diphasiastrum complanatum TaxID=34168 RepID=A0ACC2CCM5_DIPCM|nr:hypothetical protein O6H91_Y020100 [Diphasiastrum complanatum]KAJ7539760.1 hypothetical protein O6H91_11G107800 [Diphasiastrum complanatum]
MSCLSLSRLCSPGVLSHASSSASSPDSGCPLDPKSKTSYCRCLSMSKNTEDDSEAQDHLDKHAHLTNCIHLKNRFHIQKHSMVMEARHPGELPLMRELTALSRAKSLRDPSTCSTWKSPQRGTGISKRKGSGDGVDQRDDSRGKERAGEDRNGRIKKRDESRAKERVGDDWDGMIRKDESRGRERAVLGGEASGGSRWDGNIVDYIGGGFADKARLTQSLQASDEPRNVTQKNVVERDPVEGMEQETGRGMIASNWDVQALKASHRSKVHPDTVDCRDRVSKRYGKRSNAKTLGTEISQSRDGENPECGEGFDIQDQGRPHEKRRTLHEETRQAPSPLSLINSIDDPHSLEQAMSLLRMGEQNSDKESSVASDEAEISPLAQQMVALSLGLRSRSQSPLLARNTIRKSRKNRSGRISQIGSASRAIVKDNQSSNKRTAIFTGELGGRNYIPGEAERPVLTTDEGESEPRNGCGIPWYWSRLQKHRGKSFLDLAGRSLSCGYPEFSRRAEGTVSRAQGSLGRELVLPTFPSDRSVSSLNSDPETLSFMLEPDLSLHRANTPASPVNINSIISPNESLDTSFRERNDRPGIDIRGASLRERLGLMGFPSSRMEGIDDVRGRSISQRYRPKSYKELVGQTLVVQALRNAILKEKVASFYLFQGPRGTGKTCAARIFASALVCLSSEELRPCGSCRECVTFNLGNHMDVVEVDSTSRSKMDSMKHLVDYVLLPPSARFKVSIIDECHLLTAETWNMLLKRLEEPPAHVVFILITSEPEHLPRTATSRCQKFLFHKIKGSDIVARLQQLAWKENVEVEQDALELIALRADGSLRDAETTLDQLCLLGNKVTLPTVQELAGLIPKDKLLELLDMAMSGQTVDTVKMVRELLVSGIEALALISQLATLITDFLAGNYSVAKMRNKERFSGRQKLTKKELARLRQALKILSESEKQIRTSSDQTTWLTASLLQFAPDRSLISQTSSAEASVAPSIVAASDTSEKEAVNAGAQKALESHGNASPRSLDEPGNGLSKPRSKERREHIAAARNVTKSNTMSRSSEKRKKKYASSMAESTVQSSDHSSLNYDYVQELSSKFLQNRLSADSNLPHGTLETARIGGGQLAGRKAVTPMHQQKMADVWRRVLQGSRSKVVKQLLKSHGELISLSITEAYAVAYVEFRHPQQKLRAERSLSSISHTFQAVLGCPVEVRVTLASFPAECERIKIGNTILSEQEDRTPALNSKVTFAVSKTPDDKHFARNLSKRHLTTVAEQNIEGEIVQPELPLEQRCVELTSACGDTSKGHLFHTKEGAVSPNGERLENAWVQEAKINPPLPKLDGLHSQRYRDSKGKLAAKNGSLGRVLSGFVKQAEGSKEGYRQDMQLENTAGLLTRKNSKHLQPDFTSSSLHSDCAGDWSLA